MRAVALASLLLLAACATGVPVERQVVVPGDRFIAVQGEAALFVRTFLPPRAGTRREVVGADCRIVSSLYAAERRHPLAAGGAELRPAVARARRHLHARASSPAPAAPASSPAGSSRPGAGAIPGPGMGPPWGWGMPGWGWYEPSYPVSDYPDLIVTLR